MINKILVAGVILFAAWYWWPAPESVAIGLDFILESPPAFDPGLSIERPPLQTAIDNDVEALTAGDFRIVPVANFQLEARVLGRRNYRRGVEARVSPLDLALGWGPMARPEVLEKISIRLSNRFYYWSTPDFPIPRREIETSSANMHMIPAGEPVARALNDIREGQTVRLSGYLVNVERADGWRWRTSLTRQDTGRGACEIVLVRKVEIL